MLGILCAAATLLVGLAVWSYDADGGENWIGPVGEALAGVLATAFGVAAWLVPLELGLGTARLFTRSNSGLGIGRVASTVVIVLIGCAMVHLALGGQTVFGGHLPGGALGEVMGEVLRSLLGVAGAYVVGTAILLITIVLRTPFSVIEIARKGGVATLAGAKRARAWLRDAWAAWREAKELERLEREEAALAAAPRIVSESTLDESLDAEIEPVIFAEADPAEVEMEDEEEEEEPAPPPLPKKKAPRAAAKATAKGKASGPTIVAPREESAGSPNRIRMPEVQGDFALPPTDLFDAPPAQQIQIDATALRANAIQLTEKLEAYRVKGRVDEIHPGPVVTMYEFEPESGTKISKIAGLSDDLAMALAAHKVRIVAPIPGKARVGFELPNEIRQTVYMREVLEDDRWTSLKAALPVAFGKDIAGQPVYGDLARMPHLLVAGATGSGKSVGLNVMLCSLLSRRSPEEVRLLMIDPKVVELAVFDGIPHMLLPVVTDMKKASLALRWAVDEMERRYQLFADAGARNITTYNKRIDRVLSGELTADNVFTSRKGKVKARGADGQEVLLDPADGEAADANETPPERLPYVVVVVDEFADLMMVAAKDVEAAIARLAQKARAAGIHVILATQRPSVDVITGMIKANFPARIGFKVSQREDSKTILGRQGAEHLLGMGDMLMIPPGSSDLHRVHSAYVSEEEVKRLCDHLREQGKPVYDEKILEPRGDDDGADGGGGPASDDPIYDKAVACVAQAGYCSISHIQRQLGVGYNKAAKLVERMEQEGVVGPPSGKAGGRREVLVQTL
ncbi:MAG: DNA translocase FtsK 4TM domain-containing protein [Sandaracinaceae bacterium]|nr:DNA translocase FtsK 4TM domain-containing protein [Sandaracinaceae bacterium]